MSRIGSQPNAWFWLGFGPRPGWPGWPRSSPVAPTVADQGCPACRRPLDRAGPPDSASHQSHQALWVSASSNWLRSSSRFLLTCKTGQHHVKRLIHLVGVRPRQPGTYPPLPPSGGSAAASVAIAESARALHRGSLLRTLRPRTTDIVRRVLRDAGFPGYVARDRFCAPPRGCLRWPPGYHPLTYNPHRCSGGGWCWRFAKKPLGVFSQPSQSRVGHERRRPTYPGII